MKRIRVIPALLIHKAGLVKSVKFVDYKYVGDPINAVKIFNDKEVDELAILDIDASAKNQAPDIKKIAAIVSEAFMPIAYGGGITTIDQVKEILFSGVEKIILNKSAVGNPKLVSQIAGQFGSQSVVISMDVKRSFIGGRRVYTDNGKVNTRLVPEEFARQMENAGAGEILLNSIDRDGTFEGYDLDLVQSVSSTVGIPVIALGGAGSVADFAKAIQAGASAVAAGSLFVFQRPHRAVLISYPSSKDLSEKLFSRH